MKSPSKADLQKRVAELEGENKALRDAYSALLGTVNGMGQWVPTPAAPYVPAVPYVPYVPPTINPFPWQPQIWYGTTCANNPQLTQQSGFVVTLPGPTTTS